MVTSIVPISQMKRWKHRRLRNLPKIRRLVRATAGIETKLAA